MPFYQLKCNACGKTFEARASIAERNEKKIPCPECGGFDHATVYGKGPAVHVRGESGGNACPHAESCGCCCPHAHR